MGEASHLAQQQQQRVDESHEHAGLEQRGERLPALARRFDVVHVLHRLGDVLALRRVHLRSWRVTLQVAPTEDSCAPLECGEGFKKSTLSMAFWSSPWTASRAPWSGHSNSSGRRVAGLVMHRSTLQHSCAGARV
jgi:hypothetical protein